MNHDIQVLGKSVYQAVRSSARDDRDWLKGSPTCALLAQHHISHVGIMKAQAPFHISRIDQSGTFMMTTLEGEGEVLVDGRWAVLRSGVASLLPPFVHNAFKCSTKKTWSFCWVRYLESRESYPIASNNTPVMGAYNGEPLFHAISGLYVQCLNSGQSSIEGLWTDLIHQYVLQFAQSHQYDERLIALWKTVQVNLSQKWTLESLAAKATVGPEHLRRLCLKHLGRSPMQHLTFLRMQQARQLLRDTHDKVDTIARAVGYESAFTFSNTFTKWVGWRPSEHRR